MSGGPLVAIDLIHPNPANVRRDLGDLTELAASIRAQGLLQPLVVSQVRGGWVVLDGHRRLAAARMAGAKALPCLAVRPGDRNEQLAVMLAASMHKQLEPVEQGAAFRALRNSGLSVLEIARRTGYSAATISGRLLLEGLPTQVKEMVEDKELTVTEATALARQLKRESTGTASTSVTKSAWLVPTHRLAAAAAADCTHLTDRRSIGGVACGQCWERAIADDAVATLTTSLEGAHA